MLAEPEHGVNLPSGLLCDDEVTQFGSIAVSGRTLFNSSDEVELELECMAISHSLNAALAEPEHGLSLPL